MPDELLTVAEVADLLKLNQQTIRNIIDRGELGHVRVGQRRVRVRQSQLDAFLAAGESGPQPAEPDPWHAVNEAATSVAAAVRAQDRDALDRAISTLTDAATEIPPQAEVAARLTPRGPPLNRARVRADMKLRQAGSDPSARGRYRRGGRTTALTAARTDRPANRARAETPVAACPTVARPPMARAAAPALSDPRVRVTRGFFHALRVPSTRRKLGVLRPA